MKYCFIYVAFHECSVFLGTPKQPALLFCGKKVLPILVILVRACFRLIIMEKLNKKLHIQQSNDFITAKLIGRDASEMER